MAFGELHLPKAIVPALLSISVFARVNGDQTSTGGHYLSLGQDQFQVADWWGRESDFRPIAAARNTPRLTLLDTGGA
jgi:hypothetical protein